MQLDPVLKKGNDRVNIDGRAYAGSQRQLQTYVNERTLQLSTAMLAALNLELQPVFVEWISPLARDRYAEYKDADFLNALGLGSLKDELTRFWPNSGPRWDGLARFVANGANNYVFVEAKSHVPEMYSGGCCATSRCSLDKIHAALDQTKAWLGVRSEADWTGRLYQSANRIAHLFWFREVLGLQAWLVNIYFVSDPHSPTSLTAWKDGIRQAKAAMEISSIVIPGLVELILPACD